ncbi:MAG: FAD-dependent oxidoreductase, partial [Deltaproteobacteria bacterium]|nr:FAD-dependent oxidoreductase [Deltaproteobacteria bacterium]
MAEEFPNRNRDVVVVGGGMGGLTAAIQAKNCGARVVLVEKS